MEAVSYNRVKILATAGPACQEPAVLQRLILAGVDVLRLNLSHGSWEQHRYFIEQVRRLNLALGTHVALLADLQGPKMRVGKLEAPSPSSREMS